VQYASHSNQLPKCFADNRNVTAGRLAVPPWKMVHPHLLDRHAKPGCLSEDFRVNHRAHTLDLDTVEDAAVEDFESTINVADPDPEHKPHEDIPTPGKQQPVRRVLSPGPVPGNDVVGMRLFEERGHFL
jgi:hypothetical protein